MSADIILGFEYPTRRLGQFFKREVFRGEVRIGAVVRERRTGRWFWVCEIGKVSAGDWLTPEAAAEELAKYVEATG